MTVSARAPPGTNAAITASAAPPANTLKRFLVRILPPRRGRPRWRKHAITGAGGAITFGKFRPAPVTGAAVADRPDERQAEWSRRARSSPRRRMTAGAGTRRIHAAAGPSPLATATAR